MVGKICGTGSYVPGHILDNHDLSKIVDTNDEWIQARTGIIRRHIIEEDTTVSMAVYASKEALEDSGTAAEELDLILVSTFTSQVLLPCTACEVQKELGAVNATGFDLNAACTGFLFAYNTAQAYIHAGIYKTILIIGAESLSNVVNWKDRGTCILFGDGAGACVMKAQQGEFYRPITCSAGTLGNALTCKSRCCNAQDSERDDVDFFMKMDGQAVFKFAVRRVPEVILEAVDEAGIKLPQIDYFILHQANKRIVEAVAKRLGEDINKFPMNMEEYGNTSSASIPILLDEMNKKGMLKEGNKLVMAGFGAGLSWGAIYLEW